MVREIKTRNLVGVNQLPQRKSRNANNNPYSLAIDILWGGKNVKHWSPCGGKYFGNHDGEKRLLSDENDLDRKLKATLKRSAH